ncbi:MAG: hypothetical protein JWO59_3137, partial [Chloroflexi bacterium]|nr:hypothetical protein [Chloroflexota bacterium]
MKEATVPGARVLPPPTYAILMRANTHSLCIVADIRIMRAQDARDGCPERVASYPQLSYERLTLV